MNHDINEMIASIWRDKGGTAKTFNESWQFIEHMIAEKEKEEEESLRLYLENDGQWGWE